MKTTDKADGECKGGHGDKKVTYPTSDYQRTKQNRVETSGSRLVISFKTMEETECLDKSKACSLYAL